MARDALHVGNFDLRATWDAVAFGAGLFVIAVLSARVFGPLHGGDRNGSHESS